jgi:RNA polymerase sigma-70 factor (ECF subfamily)
MRHLTLSAVERVAAEPDETDVAFEMDEETFRAFYDRTARALWGYLSKVTGDPHLADDLLQEAYYRFLRVRGDWESEAHRRAYLFRIATNLVHDGRRRAGRTRIVPLTDSESDSAAGHPDLAARTERRADLKRAMDRLRPRDRALLWLAYAQGHPHTEIAGALGVKTASVKQLLFRARRRLATLLRAGDSGGEQGEN